MALALALLVIGFAESAVYAVVEAFDRPVTFVGPLITVQGLGAVTMGLLSSRVVRRMGEPTTIVVGLVVTTVGLVGVVAAAEVWQLLVAVAVLGAGIPMIFVAFNTLVQKHTPGRLMGRVSTTIEVLVTTPQALSIGAGALLVGLLDYRTIFALMAGGTLVAAGYLATALRGLRSAATGVPDVPLVGDDEIPGTVLPEPLGAGEVRSPTDGPGAARR